jgi:hypothetical protein
MPLLFLIRFMYFDRIRFHNLTTIPTVPKTDDDIFKNIISANRFALKNKHIYRFPVAEYRE